MKKTMTIQLLLWSISFALMSCNRNANAKDGTNANTGQDTLNINAPCIPDAGLSAGAKLLFGCTETNLTIEDRNAIFELCGFHAANDSVLYVEDDMQYLTGTEEDMGLELSVDVYIYDLNKDGVDEALVQFGNSMWGGTAGVPSALFTKDKNGKMRLCMDSYGMGGLEIMETSTLGWNDVVIGGGMNHVGLWKWSGSEYKFSKQVTR